ncbi:MAG: Gfo/Idh/MocA family oxidoreductase, partial [Planctomycetes bacterium]|nr:Gfo/Idh/MocA family oxidoreductase [Planctomycetota bacterium]
LTVAGAHAGRHVLCEKPLDVTLAAAAAAAEACHAAGVRLFPVFQGRFGVARHLLQAVRSGRLGDLVNVRVSMKWRRDDAYYASAAWRGTRRLDGGGCLINQAIHGIDLALAAAGPAVSVQAEVANRSHPHLEVEDTVALLLRHRDGALTIFEATTSTDQELPMEIEATGTRGTIAIAGNAIVRWQLADGSAPPTPEPDEPSAEAPETEHRSWKHRRQFADVLRALKDGRQPTVVVDDGLRALATVEAAYAAGRLGAAVTPKEWPTGAWASTRARMAIGGARIIENATSCAAT